MLMSSRGTEGAHHLGGSAAVEAGGAVPKPVSHALKGQSRIYKSPSEPNCALPELRLRAGGAVLAFALRREGGTQELLAGRWARPRWARPRWQPAWHSTAACTAGRGGGCGGVFPWLGAAFTQAPASPGGCRARRCRRAPLVPCAEPQEGAAAHRPPAVVPPVRHGTETALLKMRSASAKGLPC